MIENPIIYKVFKDFTNWRKNNFAKADLRLNWIFTHLKITYDLEQHLLIYVDYLSSLGQP